MLKLLKYEWKACARTCLPLYGVLILMSLISRILYVIPKNASLDFMLPAIGSMLYMGVMMAAFVVTAVILIQRFYKNLLGSEGYLMFTLPVTVSQHLLSKTIIAVVMIALSGIAAFLSIGIFADMFFVASLAGFCRYDKGCGAERRPAVRAGAARAGGASALQTWRCSSICAWRSAIWRASHRLLMSVVWYVVLSTAVQVLLLMVMMGAGNAVPEPLVDAMVRLA